MIAGVTLSVFHVAFERWVHGEDDRELPDVARDAMRELGTLMQGYALEPEPRRPLAAAAPGA